jgi:hypothetical protein
LAYLRGPAAGVSIGVLTTMAAPRARLTCRVDQRRPGVRRRQVRQPPAAVDRAQQLCGSANARRGQAWTRRLEPHPLIVDDLSAEVARLRNVGARFRNDIIERPGGKQILLQDPPATSSNCSNPPSATQRDGMSRHHPAEDPPPRHPSPSSRAFSFEMAITASSGSSLSPSSADCRTTRSAARGRSLRHPTHARHVQRSRDATQGCYGEGRASSRHDRTRTTTRSNMNPPAARSSRHSSSVRSRPVSKASIWRSSSLA